MMHRYAKFLLGFILLVNLIYSGSALANGFEGTCWGGWPHMMSWGWGGMFMVGIVGLILVLAVFYLVFQHPRSSTEQRDRVSDTPFEVLQKRYARGEISREEYQRMKEDLKG